MVLSLSEKWARVSKAEGLTADQLRQAVVHTRQKLATSERRTCRVIGLARSTLQYKAAPKDDEALRLAMIRSAKQYGRYGYRKVAELLRIEGWSVNHKKIERLSGSVLLSQAWLGIDNPCLGFVRRILVETGRALS